MTREFYNDSDTELLFLNSLNFLLPSFKALPVSCHVDSEIKKLCNIPPNFVILEVKRTKFRQMGNK